MVDNAGRGGGCSTPTVQRQRKAGWRLGPKLGRTWVVWGSCDTGDAPGPVRSALAPSTSLLVLPAAVVQERLQEVGARRITMGNAVAHAQPGRGKRCVAWRRSGSLRVTLAIGRLSPHTGMGAVCPGGGAALLAGGAGPVAVRPTTTVAV